MGAEAACTVTVGRRRIAGKALLETSELLFRSPELRLKVPFASITSAEAKGGRLVVAWDGERATFELGNLAERWAVKIRNPKSVIEMLGVKSGQRVAVLGITDAAFLAALRERAATVSNGRVMKECDAIFLGAEDLAGLKRIPTLLPYLTRDGAIWTVTPKGKGGVKDTDVMAAGKRAGLADVKVVSFSATHSANKFVVPKAAR